MPLFERLTFIYEPADLARVHRSLYLPKQVAWLANRLVDAATLPAGEPVSGLPGCFVLPDTDRDKLMAHPAVESGAAYPTNPSSVLAARALGVRADQEVLDLAAAPGGKTLHLGHE